MVEKDELDEEGILIIFKDDTERKEAEFSDFGILKGSLALSETHWWKKVIV